MRLLDVCQFEKDLIQMKALFRAQEFPCISFRNFCVCIATTVWSVDKPVHVIVLHMSRLTTKPTKWHVRPAKTQINLGFAQSDRSRRCPHEESLGP